VREAIVLLERGPVRLGEMRELLLRILDALSRREGPP
jgi:hypothetical protein